jgi:hypothetical protein
VEMIVRGAYGLRLRRERIDARRAHSRLVE